MISIDTDEAYYLLWMVSRENKKPHSLRRKWGSKSAFEPFAHLISVTAFGQKVYNGERTIGQSLLNLM